MSEATIEELLAHRIRNWARELGFQSMGIAGIDLAPHDTRFRDWLARGHHGEMEYMQRHGERRWRPDELLPGTLRVLSLRMDYLVADDEPFGVLDEPARAYVARYARGRDYHKLMRTRLSSLARRIESERPDASQRVFIDSAPVLERALARESRAGLDRQTHHAAEPAAGSWFFLGEIYTDLPLPVDAAEAGHCGTCQRLPRHLPHPAPSSRPYARRAALHFLSHHRAQGQRSRLNCARCWATGCYGCDDCQLVCPWNQLRANRHAAGFWAEKRTRQGAAGGTACLERGRFQRTPGGLTAPPHRT